MSACEECGGSGVVNVRVGGLGEPEWDGEGPCGVCGGTGEEPELGPVREIPHREIFERGPRCYSEHMDDPEWRRARAELKADEL